MPSKTPPLGSYDSYSQSQEQSVRKTTLTKSYTCGVDQMKNFNNNSELDPVPEAREETNEDGTFVSSPNSKQKTFVKNYTTSVLKTSTTNSVDTPKRQSGPATTTTQNSVLITNKE